LKHLSATVILVLLAASSAFAGQRAAFSDEDIQKAGKNKAALDFRLQPPLTLPIIVTKTQWTEKDEELFGQFVTRMGDAVAAKKCNTVKSCMKNKDANMYASTDPASLVFYADCGLFPYVLRAYFAYKNHLPFSIVSTSSINQVPYASAPSASLDESLPTSEGEAAPYGNKIEARDIKTNADRPGEERNFQLYLGQIVDFISTRIYRIGPLTPNYNLSDLYPVTLDRKGIRAGTIVHTTGHVYLVTRVDEKGTIHLVDAHPDGSVSGRKTISSATLERSRPDQGLGFYRFRPTRLTGAQLINGSLYGGEVSRPTDTALYQEGLYSLEQYFGPGSKVAPGAKVNPNLWKQGYRKIDFFAYLEGKLRPSTTQTMAIDDVSDLLKAFCNEIEQRVTDVDQALAGDAKLNLQPHPAEIPPNIFTSNDSNWEAYSSPSRDGRMRASVVSIANAAITKFKQSRKVGGTVHFEGSAQDYQNTLHLKLQQISNKCIVKYTNSAGRQIPLTMLNVMSRLTKISFDPYHCAEKRWGASGQELASCQDQDGDSAWYTSEQVIRNTIGKSTPTEQPVARSNRPITLLMLQDPSLSDQPETADVNLGTKAAPNLNLDAIFMSPKFLDQLR
jgi:hypothetical protein